MAEETTIQFGDPITAPFWEAAARHELVFQRCRNCGRPQWYPRPYCLHCQSDDVEWVKGRGAGTIYSMTTVHIQVDPELESPYVVALVELDEGQRILSHIVGEEEARIGDRVEVAWKGRTDLPPLPVFRLRRG